MRVLAEVFGWEADIAPGQRGPDIIIKHVNPRGDVISVMFVESEVGHNQRSSEEYFELLCRRLADRIRKYRGEGVRRIVIVVITNAPRRLSNYIKREGDRIAGELGLEYIKEGSNFYIVSAVLLRDVLPAIFVKAIGVDTLVAHDRV